MVGDEETKPKPAIEQEEAHEEAEAASFTSSCASSRQRLARSSTNRRRLSVACRQSLANESSSSSRRRRRPFVFPSPSVCVAPCFVGDCLGDCKMRNVIIPSSLAASLTLEGCSTRNCFEARYTKENNVSTPLLIASYLDHWQQHGYRLRKHGHGIVRGLLLLHQVRDHGFSFEIGVSDCSSKHVRNKGAVSSNSSSDSHDSITTAAANAIFDYGFLRTNFRCFRCEGCRKSATTLSFRFFFFSFVSQRKSSRS